MRENKSRKRFNIFTCASITYDKVLKTKMTFQMNGQFTKLIIVFEKFCTLSQNNFAQNISETF